jgi:hypothetical protein
MVLEHITISDGLKGPQTLVVDVEICLHAFDAAAAAQQCHAELVNGTARK